MPVYGQYQTIIKYLVGAVHSDGQTKVHMLYGLLMKVKKRPDLSGNMYKNWGDSKKLLGDYLC